MVQELLPFVPDAEIDAETTRALLADELGFAALSTLPGTDMPRVSGMLENYRIVYIRLAYHFRQQGDTETAKQILDMMDEKIPRDLLPIREDLEGIIRSLKGEE